MIQIANKIIEKACIKLLTHNSFHGINNLKCHINKYMKQNFTNKKSIMARQRIVGQIMLDMLLVGHLDCKGEH
jgi:hypothetical protein